MQFDMRFNSENSNDSSANSFGTIIHSIEESNPLTVGFGSSCCSCSCSAAVFVKEKLSS